MPSLAKKSMNFMRDVYALANEHANSGRPPNTQQPAGGLSSQFAVPQNPHYNNQPSPYLRPVSSQGQGQGPVAYSQNVPGPYPQHPPQQPHGSWSPALTPPTHFHPPSVQHSHSVSNGNNGYVSPQPQQFPPPSPISSPVSPQSYVSPTGNEQFQYFQPQRPPLPERQPSQQQPSWNGQPQGPQYPYSNNQHQHPYGVPTYTPPTNSSSPVQQQQYPSQNGSTQQVGARPLPPPLPQRPVAQHPNVVGGPSVPSANPHYHQQSHTAPPAVTVSEHSSEVYHEMPALSTQGRISHSHHGSYNSAELPGAVPQRSPSLFQDSKTYTAELEGSPISPVVSAVSAPDRATNSSSSLHTPSRSVSTPSVSSQVPEANCQSTQGPVGRSEYPVGQGAMSPPTGYEQSSRPVPPEQISHVAYQAPYAPPLQHHSSSPPRYPGQPGSAQGPQSPGNQYSPASSTSGAPDTQAPNAPVHSAVESSFNMNSLAAAVNNIPHTQSGWSHPTVPTSAMNYTTPGDSQPQIPPPVPSRGAPTGPAPQNFHSPQAWNNSSPDHLNYQQHPAMAMSPQNMAPLTQPQMHQQARSLSSPPVQTYSLPPTPQINPQVPFQPPAASHNPNPQYNSEPQANTMRLQNNGNQPRVRKILSLDGGGVRGLSSLIILDYLMDRLGDMRGARLEPWQEFDMIAGTSTGGLIAIMLGRLRMSVPECIEAYKHLSREIFTPTHSAANTAGKTLDFLKAKGKFRSEPLEQCVKQMLKAHNLAEDELMLDKNPDSPAMFVCAVEALNSDAVVIRSYKSKAFDDLYGVCKIWEAARATSAASTFFDPINIAGRDYVDGALKHNNPIKKVDHESKAKWPNDQRLIISIGTGSAPGPNLTGGLITLVDALKKIVTETEERSNEFRMENRDMIVANRLFRFNVFHGLADVGLAEHEAEGKVRAHTKSYLLKFDTAEDVELCATALKETGQRLGYIAGEELATYREIQRVSTTTCEFCEECHQGITYSDALFFCPECGMLICKNCQITHDESHMRKLIRFRSMQWMPNLPGIPSTVSCWHCAKDTKVRWGCDKCDLALCRRCAGNLTRRDEFLKEHQEKQPDHRSFLATYPPFWTTKPHWKQDKCPCVNVQPAPAMHCDRCHGVILIGSRAINCRDCMTEFGAAQALCMECYNQEDPSHLSKHRWITTDFVLSEHGLDEFGKDMKLTFHCPLCPNEKIYEGREHLHQHSSLHLLVSPLLVELCRIANTQACQRDRIRGDRARAVDPTATITCQNCCNVICYDKKASICLTKKCLWAYCEDCTVGRRIRHRHPLYEVTINRAPAGATHLVKCCICMAVNVARTFKGLWCGDCDNFDVCIMCAVKVEQGTMTLPEGLPHMKVLKQCKSRSWIWYI